MAALICSVLAADRATGRIRLSISDVGEALGATRRAEHAVCNVFHETYGLMWQEQNDIRGWTAMWAECDSWLRTGWSLDDEETDHGR